MRIAITYDKETGNIAQHFGHTEAFKVYEIKDKKVVLSYILDAEGSGHEALGEFLAQNKVDAVLCGGIGGGAVAALNQMGILLYGGIRGNADEAMNILLNGKLTYSSEPNCTHHHDEEGGCHCHHEEGEMGECSEEDCASCGCHCEEE